MSKFSKLAEPIACEWVTPSTGVMCGRQFSDVPALTAHLREHVRAGSLDGHHHSGGLGLGVGPGWLGGPWGPGGEGRGDCHWAGCDFSSLSPLLFTSHVLYHAHHSYLKLLGAEVSGRARGGLPPCRMWRGRSSSSSSSSANAVPPLDDNALRCEWVGGDGGDSGDDGGGGGSGGRGCGAVFDCVGEFYQHVHRHAYAATDKKFSCKWKGCVFKGRDRSKLLEHTRSHTKEKVVACPTCGSVFASNMKFKDHLTRQVEASSANPGLSCSYCHKCLPNERLLREHVRKHINAFKCPHCDLTCNSPSRLLDHMRYRHTESKPHECPLCQKKFKTSYSLGAHVESHRQKSYACGVAGCRYTAKTLKGLQSHLQARHVPDMRMYNCHVCNSRLSSGKQLTHHLKNVHGFELPPGHCRFRYVDGPDGLKRLQTVRLDDENMLVPELDVVGGGARAVGESEGSGLAMEEVEAGHDDGKSLPIEDMLSNE